MDSKKILTEFCLTNGNLASITLDLLPKNFHHHRCVVCFFSPATTNMADVLHKAIRAMSIEDEEEPLTLPDEPRFRVFDENETSLLERLLNPDYQSMSRMIEYMMTAWRVYDRFQGIALSRDRFQFIFQREEDLQTVLKDRPWSYNHWTIALERWTANPPDDFLKTMDLWIRIRHIPVNHFTSDTMYRLASEVGKVDVIAYDPKVSQTKDYIRAKVCFNLENPAKASRKMNIKSGGTVITEFEYEKIHKRCFHCLRLTHEKIRCPLLRQGNIKDKQAQDVQQGSNQAAQIAKPLMIAEGPPGFPPLFPELSKQDQKMAMLYISHANETERRARIKRVKQGIADSTIETSIRLTKITNELDKGKGHVFSYQEETAPMKKQKPFLLVSRSEDSPGLLNDDEADSSATNTSFASAPTLIPTGFQLGPSSGGGGGGGWEGGASHRVPKCKQSSKKKASFMEKENRKQTCVFSWYDFICSRSSSTCNKMKRKSSPPPSS
ncbi:uncharacterized protein LOC125579786 [Brassica napus]|uniref:uncharacterized protein LOC125579786 n=1 Tax=Brassica napus TaxID=3708 RepID=UPI002078C8CA|nr:uncharacterized protein LOC125579786 [Brassica napus]